MIHNSLFKLFVFILILAFYGTIVVHKISFHTDDLGRHFQNGKMVLEGNFDVLRTNFYSQAEPDYPFINDHWLSGVVFYFLYVVFGFNGLIVFAAIVLLGAFSLLFWIALKRADFWLIAALSIPTILILRERTDIRPEIFSYLFMAVFIYFLYDLEKHPERRRVFWLIPLQFLWVNLHTFFIVGPMLAVGFLAEKIILNYKNLKNNLLVKKLALLLFALIAVNFINPNGTDGAIRPITRFMYTAVEVTEDHALLDILRIKPVEDISILIFLPLIFVLGISLFLGFVSKKRPIFLGLASVGTIAASFIILRTMPFFGLIFLLAASSNLNGVFLKLKEWLELKSPRTENILRKFLTPILIALFIVLIFLGVKNKISKYNEFGLGLVSRSNDAAEFFKEQKLRGPIFNDHSVGSYLIWHLYPQEKTFFDNRGRDAYSANFVYDVYKSTLENEDVWQSALKKYKFNVIFFFQYDGIFLAYEFLRRRMLDPDWALVYADNNAVILLQNNKENQEIINRFGITQKNVGEKLRYLSESRNIDDRIAAGDLFNLMDREDLALSTYGGVVAEHPGYSKIWRIMGETAVLLNNEKSDILAVIYLERAIALGQKNADAYSWLGLAYFRLGRFNDAEEILQKALKLDPNRQDTQLYLNKLQEHLKLKKDSIY
jgi:tetratricopeptide (TPR) repeat protein